MRTLYLLSLLLLAGFSGLAQAGEINLQPDEFEKAIQQNNIQLLDVRTAGEYQLGHLASALQANWNNEKEFRERVAALDKQKPVYVYCLSGPRSTAATLWLNENGFKAYNLAGGMNAWKRMGKAVEQQAAVKPVSLDEFNDQLPANGLALVEIGAIWCPPCKKMTPVIDSLSNHAQGKYTVIRIDGGAQTSLATQLNADSFPTFIVYKNRKEIWRGQGILPAETLLKHLH